MQQTDAQLTAEANVIGNETTAGANTADRVRDHLINLIDSKGNNFTTFRKTAAQWTSDNTVLGDGVKGEETDTGKFKVGPGAWNSLSYGGGGGTGFESHTMTDDVIINADGNTVTIYDAQEVEISSGDTAHFIKVNDTAASMVHGNSVSSVVANASGVHITGERVSIPTGASDPGTPSNGQMYYNTSTNKFRVYQGSAWSDMSIATNSAGALTDGSAVTLTATKHTLTSVEAAITFTITYAGDDIVIELTLNATSATWTFPAGSLCVSEGVASGDNTLGLTGVSGDKYIITTKKIGSVYYVVAKNFGQ